MRLILTTLGAATLGSVAIGQSFVDRTLQLGITHTQSMLVDVPNLEYFHMTGGAAAGDYDKDGWCDLFVTRIGATDILYRNLGNNSQGNHLGFADVTAAVFTNQMVSEDSNGAAWGDVDDDGNLDLFVTSIFGHVYRLYMNDGQGRFIEQALARGAALADGNLHFGYSPAFGDYDRDGYLDLYVSEWGNPAVFMRQDSHSRLLRNRGVAAPGFFTDETVSCGVEVEDLGGMGVSGEMDGVYTFAPRFTDLDADGWPELAIAGDFNTSRLFWNNGDGTFEHGTEAAGVGTDENGMGFTTGDVNGDGLFDLFVTSIYDEEYLCLNNGCNWGATGNRLFINAGDRTFVDRTSAAGVRDGGWGWGTSWLDYDNDGLLDLVMTNGVDFPGPSVDDFYATDPMRLWRNEGPTSAMSQQHAAEGIADTGSGKGLLTFDFDNDGDVDIFVVNNLAAPVLYENVSDNGNSWVQFRLQGRASNFYGIGARLYVTPVEGGPTYQQEVSASSNFLAQNEVRAHFGLGEGSAPIHLVEVRWPSGNRWQHSGLARNEVHLLLEPNVVPPPLNPAGSN
jgi:hypothetical protein